MTVPHEPQQGKYRPLLLVYGQAGPEDGAAHDLILFSIISPSSCRVVPISCGCSINHKPTKTTENVLSPSPRGQDSAGLVRLGGSVSCFSQLLGLPAVLGIARLADASLQFPPLSSHGLLPWVSVALFPSCLFFAFLLLIGLKAHPNPRWSPGKILHLMTSANTPFFHRSHFSRDRMNGSLGSYCAPHRRGVSSLSLENVSHIFSARSE